MVVWFSSMRRFMALFAYLLAVFLFFEATSRAFLRSDELFRALAGTDASSWRLRFVRRGPGRAGYGFDIFDPRRGWALAPGLRDQKVFSEKTLNSDALGFRGTEEYSESKPPGRLRILVLGDSFTFGEDLSDKETYAALLESSLPGVDVMNLGVHGYGHDQMLIALQEIGPRVHPDFVLLGFVAEDMERNLVDFRDFSKPRFLLEGDALVLQNVPVPSPEEVRKEEFFRSKFLDLLRMVWDRYTWRSRGNERRMSALTFRILEEIARTSRSLGARPLFAYLPVYGEIDKADNTMTQREHAFFSFCREHDIQSMYLRPFFLKKLRAGVHFKTFGHWGPLEHQTAAEGMRAYLVEKQLLAPQGSAPVP
jgi:hypothetical protein